MKDLRLVFLTEHLPNMVGKSLSEHIAARKKKHHAGPELEKAGDLATETEKEPDTDLDDQIAKPEDGKVTDVDGNPDNDIPLMPTRDKYSRKPKAGNATVSHHFQTNAGKSK